PSAEPAPSADDRGRGNFATAGGPGGGIHGVDDAILHTLVYADLFDYPLTTEEIHRYLTGYPAPLSLVEEHLQRNGRSGEQWASVSRFWFLAGREHLVDLRRQRESYSQVLWPKARRFGRLIADLPFVRMVSITGSLAMHNVTNPQDDVDLLIVTAEDRVWLGRALVILVVHLGRRFGVELCPNYVMAESCLEMGEPSLYIAHELAQLLPLHGADIYHRLLKSNAWMVDYLPNASPRRPEEDRSGPAKYRGQQLVEALLGGRLGDGLEQWERERKIPRLRQIAIEKGGTGTSYNAKLCKGHIDDHAAAVQERYDAQLAELGL
ncbi:MAG: hypothetical protein PVI80_10240, partial [Anaerolineae bacterium]